MSRVVVFLLFLIAIPITNGLNPRKLDEVDENKCGGCPCNKPCVSPSPPPPPPALPPPSPPPPKKPPSSYCPPPPSGGGGSGGGGSGGGGGGGGGGSYVPDSPNSQYIYMTGPPGNLYPVDHDFNGAKRSFSSGFSLLIGGFFLGLLSFW